MKVKRLTVLLCLCLGICVGQLKGQNPPNILFIFCDDLNESGYGSLFNPAIVSPTIDSLINEGVVFTNAHSNATLCGPSRASVFTGLLPSSSGHFGRNMGTESWDENPVLSDATTIFRHLKDNGYSVYGTGKIFHKNRDPIGDFDDFDPSPFQGPYAFNQQSHPDLPPLFSELNISYSPLENVPSGNENPGWYADNNPFFFENDENRDPLGDEIAAAYADSIFQTFSNGTNSGPFFMTVGLYKPHQPFHAPQRFFDMYPIENIDVSAYELDSTKYPAASFANRMNSRSNLQIQDLLEASPQEDELLELKKFIQGYYACVSLVDEIVSRIVRSLEENGLTDNTYIIFSSDHGYHLGDKKIIKKSTLWNGATRIPLFICGPNLENDFIAAPTSLVDVYPTILRIAGIDPPTTHLLDGNDLFFLTDSALSKTIVSCSNVQEIEEGIVANSTQQNHAIVIQNFKYIHYSSGEDELYKISTDPLELNDLSDQSQFQQRRRIGHQLLAERIDSLRLPLASYHRLFYGDFEQGLNGWGPPQPDGVSTKLGKSSAHSRYLHLEDAGSDRIENRNIHFQSTSEHQLRLKGRTKTGSASINLVLRSSIDGNDFIHLNETVHFSDSSSTYVFPFTPIIDDEVQRNLLRIRATSGENILLDDIEIVQVDLENQAKDFCQNAKILVENELFQNVELDSLKSLLDQPDFGCKRLSGLTQQKWYEFTPSTELSLLIAKIPFRGDPVIEIRSNCDRMQKALLCVDEKEGRIENAIIETTPGQSYFARVGNGKKTTNEALPVRFTHQGLEYLVPSISGDVLHTNTPEYQNFGINYVQFRITNLLSQEAESFYTYPYSPSGEYDMNLLNLGEGEYSVSLSYRIGFSDITVPFGPAVVYFVSNEDITSSNRSTGLIVSPNPVPKGIGTLTIESTNLQSKLTKIVLQDLTGKILRTYSELESWGKIAIELPPNLATGIYLLSLGDEEGLNSMVKIRL